MLKVAHLCCGIGGSLWTGEILGNWRHVYALDNEPWRIACIEQQARAGWWPYLEAKCIDLAEWQPLAREVDCIAAGFVCKDISCAGTRAGLSGGHTGPTYAGVLKAIDAWRPAWVFLENSPEIRSRGRSIITGDMVARGYRWRDGTLAASECGAPHIRNRWFMLAQRADLVSRRCEKLRHGSKETGREEFKRLVQKYAANAHKYRELQPEGDNEEGWRWYSDRACSAAAEYCGAYGWNAANANVCGVVDGLANRGAIIAGLGDAWVPIQAATAWALLGGPIGDT